MSVRLFYFCFPDAFTKPKISDIDEHIERMEKLRKVADLRNDKRKYLGAIAGVIFGDSEETYALKNGFYVIEPSGDTLFCPINL
ncbi:hypothetical protein AGMMS49587_10630 [Spirochaetia bacterium]|nr:hypothetical protein AGMMS49587_10630 [Spirochaetia bacterium]